MIRYFSLLFLILATVSCSSKLTPNRSGSTGQIANYSEDISHLLPKYDIPKEDNTEVKNDIRNETANNVLIEDDNQKIDAILAKVVENNKTFNNGQGFRIQVFSGNSRTDFENAKSYLLRSFPQLEIYETYSQPTYRIKVGDFIYYQDAEKFNTSLKQRFGTTRILSDKINVKKALNIK